MLIYKVTVLLALPGSSGAHGICYLGIYYLIKHSSGSTFHFNKLTKRTRKGNLRPPKKYLNFNSNKNLCIFYHIDQYLGKTQKIRNREN